jgi:hypothetical protein
MTELLQSGHDVGAYTGSFNAGTFGIPGPFWSEILPRIRRPTLSMFDPTRKVRRIR